MLDDVVGHIIFWLRNLTFDVRGRRSGEAAKGTHKLSLWAAPLDGIVRPLGHFDCHEVSLEMQRAH